MVPPLRKCAPGGAAYTRPPAVEAKLVELVALPRDELAARCAIRRRGDPGYVPSECLIHLVRATRADNSTAQFDRFYKLLIERVLRSLPKAEGVDGKTLSLTKERIREHAFDRFVALLAADRSEYSEKLDYFEVRFDGALASLRRDAQEKAWREENRSATLEFDEETGEPSAEVERAKGSFDPFAAPEGNAELYRSRLDAAIDALPPEQSRIIEMLRQGIPIDSKEPGAVTIAKALGKSEKTIRTHRDKAFAAIRAALRAGDEA